MRDIEEILKDMDPEMRDRANKAREFLSKLSPKLFTLELPKALCKVCNEQHEMDIVAHGPGVCVVQFFPCLHVEKTCGKVSTWYDKDDNEIDIQ